MANTDETPKYINCINAGVVESIKTKSMEDVSTRVLEKINKI